MKNEENKKIVISGEQNTNLEELLGPLRDILKEKIEVPPNDEGTPAASKIPGHNDLLFQASPGLVTLIKWLIKISPPPAPRAQRPADAGAPAAEREELPAAAPALPVPGALKPSSSGWVIWLAVIALAAVYFYISAMWPK